MTSADLMELTAGALRKKCRELGAGFATAATRWDALTGLFAGPAGLAVVLSPGGQRVESQDEDLCVAEEEILVIVGKSLAPTADPGEELWKGVGQGEAFLKTLEALRVAVQSVALPAGETSGFWRFRGREGVEVEGAPFPAFELRFSCDASVDAGTGEAAWIAGGENPDEDDLEDNNQ